MDCCSSFKIFIDEDKNILKKVKAEIKQNIEDATFSKNTCTVEESYDYAYSSDDILNLGKGLTKISDGKKLVIEGYTDSEGALYQDFKFIGVGDDYLLKTTEWYVRIEADDYEEYEDFCDEYDEDDSHIISKKDFKAFQKQGYICILDNGDGQISLKAPYVEFDGNRDLDDEVPVQIQPEPKMPEVITCEFNPKDWVFKELDDGTMEVDLYKGVDPVIEVPETYNGKIVTSVGLEAFAVFLSRPWEKVKKISRKTESARKHIRKIILPKTIKYIRKNAFCECVALKEINLPEGLLEIGESAFQFCDIEKITIPASVQKIGKMAFYHMGSLHECILSPRVETIEEGVFRSCFGLKTLIIPEGVKKIGPRVFDYSGLYEIDLPQSLTAINAWAFTECFGKEYYALKVYKGSIAEEFAKKHKLNYVLK